MVRAEIDRNAAALRPGQFVEASIVAAGGDAQWSVPSGAVARVKGRAVVFVRNAEGFRAQPVSVVNETATRTVVSGRLAVGERIAVKGVAALKAALAGIGAE
jgi:cobalt-zinc-cadmium efflux system membrane fusion protein